MHFFNNDYNQGCHASVLQALSRTNVQQNPGYGEDPHCARAAELIKKACRREDMDVHFLLGGTQTNMTVIAAALRPHQGVLCAESGHIHVHETGAVESTGHKVLALPGENGKISAGQVRRAVRLHREDASFEHMAQPKMVYISHPTELGTLYTLEELEALSQVCHDLGLYLFLDGARLGYGLTAPGADVALPDLARLCDVFYIGGTKCGAMFGEAVVITNPVLGEDFRYLIKQKGAMLAKGWLLGVQFEALMEQDRYLTINAHANRLAQQVRSLLDEKGIPYIREATANQIFMTLPDESIRKLEQTLVLCPMGRVDADHSQVRLCTSWATTPESFAALMDALKKL